MRSVRVTVIEWLGSVMARFLITILPLLAFVGATAPPFTKWPPYLAYPDCARLFDRSPAGDADTDYIAATASQRLVYSDNASYLHVRRSCRDYHSRGHYAQQPLSDEEAEFPLAFATTIFQDFDFLERMFSVMYAPQNHYCYVIDAKSSDEFKKRMTAWAECFPNVIIPPVELEIRSTGHNVSAAQLACMQALSGFDWKYLILMQNHDVPLRTNAELVRILRIFNGANDISTFPISPGSIDPNATWTFDQLHLFRDESLNQAMLDDGRTKGRLHLTKSLVGVSLSQPMVDFILNQLNVTGFIDQLERWYFGIDENFLSTINSNDFIGAPGGFTRACLIRGQPVSAITRYAVWGNHPEDCRSGNFRHSVCVFGVEDLRYLMSRHQLFLNKMMPSFDYGAAMCWMEAIYNRTHFTRGGFDEPLSAAGGGDNTTSPLIVHPLHEAYYATLPTVRFNALRRSAENEDMNEEVVDWKEAAIKNNIVQTSLFRDHVGLDRIRGMHNRAGSLTDNNDNYKRDSSGFDHITFNCTHPYQDYYF